VTCSRVNLTFTFTLPLPSLVNLRSILILSSQLCLDHDTRLEYVGTKTYELDMAFDVIFTKCAKDKSVSVCVCVCVCEWYGPGYVPVTRCCEQGNETTDAMQ
jgi:hypothetical protein